MVKLNEGGARYGVDGSLDSEELDAAVLSRTHTAKKSKDKREHGNVVYLFKALLIRDMEGSVSSILDRSAHRSLWSSPGW